MTFDDFKEKMEEVYDFNDPEDCHKIIRMLLRDIETDKKSKEQRSPECMLNCLRVCVARLSELTCGCTSNGCPFRIPKKNAVGTANICSCEAEAKLVVDRIRNILGD